MPNEEEASNVVNEDDIFSFFLCFFKKNFLGVGLY